MKTLKKLTKTISWLLVIVMVFQSCTVYKSTPISLEQAAQNGSKVKVTTINKEKLKFKKIESLNDEFYSIEKFEGGTAKTVLNQDYIKSIKEKDKTLSLILNIGIPLVIVGGLLAIAAASCCGIGSMDISFPPGYW